MGRGKNKNTQNDKWLKAVGQDYPGVNRAFKAAARQAAAVAAQQVGNRQKARSQKRNGAKRAQRAQTPQAAPVAFSTMNATKDPRLVYSANGQCCRVSHRERIGTILGSTAFTVNSFAINPGLQATFPWLAAIAQRFEAYAFRNLRFEYRTKTATSALGDVIMSIDYDAADAAPATSIQAENYSGSSSAAPWQDFDHVSRAVNLHKMAQYYVRTEALAANLDIKTYDVGNLFVCTENQASAALVGYLYVVYDVDLFTPQLGSDIVGQQSGGSIASGGALSAAVPLGTVPVPDAQNANVTVDGASLITFAVPGTYVCAFTVSSGTTITALGMTAVSNATVTGLMTTVINGAATAATVVVGVVTSAANATVQLTSTLATAAASKLAVGRVPTGSLA